MNATSSASEAAWSAIEKEKRRDRLIKRTSIVAWSVTFVALLLYGAIVVHRVVWVHRALAVGASPSPQAFGITAMYEAALPLIAVVGVLSVLIATLSTIGIFLRLRTASLSEIQLRLASLEDMLRAEGREKASS